jgi:hypothetical protein
VVVVLISAIAAFVCLTINVETKETVGIAGTVVLPPGVSDEQAAQTRAALRVAGIGWMCIGILGLVWIVRNSKR